MAPRLRLEDFPDDDEERKPPPEPLPGTIAFRCVQARRVKPGLAPGTVGRVARLTCGHYHRIERGTKIPTVVVVEKIATALVALGVDVTPEWLAFQKGRAPRKMRKRREPTARHKPTACPEPMPRPEPTAPQQTSAEAPDPERPDAA
ncbi:MAG: hypothetical protein ACOY0T_37855 [Myxococcota bacterium]